MIERYEQGKIHVCYGNVAEGNTLPVLASKLADEGKTVSVAYLSNLDFYLGIRPIGDSPTDHLIKNLRTLPLSPDAIIIRSEADIMEEIPVPNDRNAEDPAFQKHVFAWRYDAFSLTDYETDLRALQNEIANSSR